jgi:hypothetical protein
MTQVHRTLDPDSDCRPVLTVLVTDHWDERWLTEIEAIAARSVMA